MENKCNVCFSELLFDGTCPVCKEREQTTKKVRSLRRFRRRKIINRRSKIYKSHHNLKIDHDGRFSKYNMSCNCWLCKYEKKAKIEKNKYKYINDEY